MKRIKKIGILQTAKVAAIIYFIIIAIFMIPMGLFSSIINFGHFPFGGLFFIVAPFLYAAIAFVFTAFGCFVYNLISDKIGGVEIELEDVQDPFEQHWQNPK